MFASLLSFAETPPSTSLTLVMVNLSESLLVTGLSGLPDFNPWFDFDRPGTETLRPGALQQVENTPGITVGLPAGFTRSMVLQPTGIIGLNDDDGILSHAGVLGIDVSMELFARKDMRA